MSVLLHSLQFSPRGSLRGWSAGPFFFSDVLTVITGPNGAGKTPLLKGLAYCLGYAIQLPVEILQNCAAVHLLFKSDLSIIAVERTITVEFRITITTNEGAVQYDNAADFSKALIKVFGIENRSFPTKDSGVSPTYTDLLLPMFWIDQDLGWRDLYCPLSNKNFVKDQAEEIIRLLLNLPGRNAAVDKHEYVEALARAEAAKQQVEIKRQVVEALEKDLSTFGPIRTSEELADRKGQLSADLRSNSTILEALSTKDSALDELISDRRSERDGASFSHQAAIRRLEELKVYGKTLDAQVAIVETNEVAADAFRILCGSQTCQFFRSPEESYGRRVLYIKDQLKDFETSLALLRRETERLRANVDESEASFRQALDQKRRQSLAASGQGIVDEVDRITREFAAVSAQLLQTQRLEEERAKFMKLVDLSVNTESAAEKLKPTRGAGRDDSSTWDAATELTELFGSWLSTLKTPNLPTQKRFDDHFDLFMGGIKFTEGSSIGGSTRTRVVLAFHAALIELSIRRGGSHPPLLILDTPKQHELDTDNLRAFVNRFVEMGKKYKVDLQLVVAAKELEFLDPIDDTVVWRPFWGTGDDARFFGKYLPSEAGAYE
jgi:hypothetical protein